MTAPAIQPRCVATLTALATPDLTTWTGLDGCSRADADAAWGPAVEGPGILGPSLHYRPGRALPNGVQAALSGDYLVELFVPGPAWSRDTLAALGPPDEDIRSHWDQAFRQWTYARHGVIAHVQASRVELVSIVQAAPLEVMRGTQAYWYSLHETEPR